MLEWNDQFEYVKNKIIVTFKKLMITEMKVHQAHMHFNAHMLTNVFFGCGIVKFNEKISELKRINEIPKIRKLGLGDKFPRKLLCVQKTRLEVGLIEPNAVIGMLAMRFYVGNKILQGDVSKNNRSA